jgi:hypothetical protein
VFFKREDKGNAPLTAKRFLELADNFQENPAAAPSDVWRSSGAAAEFNSVYGRMKWP